MDSDNQVQPQLKPVIIQFMVDDEGLFTIDDLRIRLKCRKSIIYGLIKNQLLKTIKIGRKQLITKSEFVRFLKAAEGQDLQYLASEKHTAAAV